MAKKYLEAKSKSNQNKVFRDSGIRFFALLNIPHFDIVRYYVIDPMHISWLSKAYCLYLNILTVHFSELQEKVYLIMPPSGVGRISCKIDSAFTADE